MITCSKIQQGVPQTPPDEFGPSSSTPGPEARDHDWRSKAEKKMGDYQRYVTELHRRFPHTYDNLKRFIDRGNCNCRDTYEPPAQQGHWQESASHFDGDPACKCSNPGDCDCCKCTKLGMLCECFALETKEQSGILGSGKPKKKVSCNCFKHLNTPCPAKSASPETSHTVRVYDIAPGKNTWKKYLQYSTFDAGKLEPVPEIGERPNGKGFESLKYKLFAEMPDDEDESSHTEPKDRICHVITVSHLSSSVAKLLGGKYNIPADFFNRHLPGTEALSGRLISRLPSSVQIDFQEIYEGIHSFQDELFENRNVQDGHKIIRSAMEQNLLFGEVGWDYFPVDQENWDASRNNSPLSSGFEKMAQEDLKNVFQFNFTHRISIFSRPEGHPNTAIILFYPNLPICRRPEHYPPPPPGMKPTKDRLTHKLPKPGDEHECDYVFFRGIPDNMPPMEDITYPDGIDPKEKDLEDTPAEELHRRRIRLPESLYPNQSGGEGGEKKDYASAFHREFKIHVWDHMVAAGPWDPPDVEGPQGTETLPTRPNNKGVDHSTFVDLFGVPLFNVVAANWARLIVRRKFDLDLLEWRPRDKVNSNTIEEIKSRRIAIANHLRDLEASVEVLSGLAQEKRSEWLTKRQKSPLDPGNGMIVAVLEVNSPQNKARSNGFITSSQDHDTWEKVYYDFFELKASMYALGMRADKIQDGIVGLIQVWSNEQSQTLNQIALLFSLLILPFSIVGAIFGADLTSGTKANSGVPPKVWWHFFVAIVATALAIAVSYQCYKHSPHWKVRYQRLIKRHQSKKPSKTSLVSKTANQNENNMPVTNGQASSSGFLRIGGSSRRHRTSDGSTQV